MWVKLLGQLEICDEQCCSRLPGEKLRTLLAILAMSPGRVVPTYQLIEELWVDDMPRNATNSLHAHMTRLRKFLTVHVGRAHTHDLICTHDVGYSIDIRSDNVDAHRFSAMVDKARAVRGREPERAHALLSDALALWRGPALLDVGDGPVCRLAALQLEETRLTAYEELAESRLTLGMHSALVPELEMLTERNPLRERFAEQLMLALYRCGRQAEAVDVYQRVRQRLASDLGLEPGEGLKSRLQAVLRHDPSLWLQVPSETSAAPAAAS